MGAIQKSSRRRALVIGDSSITKAIPIFVFFFIIITPLSYYFNTIISSCLNRTSVRRSSLISSVCVSFRECYSSKVIWIFGVCASVVCTTSFVGRFACSVIRWFAGGGSGGWLGGAEVLTVDVGGGAI